MPATLKVILPVTLEGDAVSVTDDAGDTSKGSISFHIEHVPSNGNGEGNVKNSCTDGTLNMLAERYCGNRTITNANEKLQEQCKNIVYGRNCMESPKTWNHELAYRNTQLLQQIQSFRRAGRKQREKKAAIAQTQHRMSGGTLANGHIVVLDKSSMRIRDSSAAPKIMEQPIFRYWQPRPRALGDVQLSVSEAYDLDMEHRDIMMKALRSYSQHCTHEGDLNNNTGDVKENMKDINLNHSDDDYKLSICNSVAGKKGQRQPTRYFSYDECENTRASVHTSRFVKMAQCRLRFYDDDVDEKGKCSPPENRPLLYTLEDGNGVLADAVGRVSRSTKTRPWSVLPGRLCDFIKVDRQGSFLGGDRRFQDLTSKNKRNKQSNRLNASPRSQSAVTFTPRAKMAQPIPRSTAYQRRNQTTHMWTDSSQLMSQSVPGESFLSRNFRASPRSSDAGSEKTSPSGKTAKARPSSSYSYDGGFFVGAHTGQAEYFVIHPDWVSEAVTVKKLSIGDKNIGSPIQRSLSMRFRSLPDGRRCLSAPPKQRNPITMDHSGFADKHK